MPAQLPEWVTYPGESWQNVSPEQAGLDPGKWAQFLGSLDVRGAPGTTDESGNPQWGLP